MDDRWLLAEMLYLYLGVTKDAGCIWYGEKYLPAHDGLRLQNLWMRTSICG